MLRVATALLLTPILGVALIRGASSAIAVELPSILQTGDTICTDEADFDDFASHGVRRSNSGIETCSQMERPVRVAVLSGRAGVKTMVRVTAGPMAYSIGWTNGQLPNTR